MTMINRSTLYLNKEKTHYIHYDIINSNEIKISGKFNSIEYFDENNKITSVSFDDLLHEIGVDFSIKIDEVDYNFSIFKITKVNNDYVIKCTKTNKSSIFVSPSLGKSPGELSYGRYFLNTFLTKNNENVLINKLFIVYRSFNNEDYVKLEEELRKDKNYVCSYDFNDTDLLIEFDIPKEFHYDISKFVEGKYSEFSELYKKKVIKFNQSLGLSESITKIFKKDKSVMIELFGDLGLEDYDGEVLSKPNMDEENIII